MMRAPTLSERILRAMAVVALAGWCLFVLVVSLGYSGPGVGRTWIIRITLLAAGALVTTALVLLGVRSWHCAVARPLPAGRGDRWLARQPGWRIAIGCWALYEAPELGTGLWLRHHGHQAVATVPHIAGLVSSAAGACVVALLCRVLWRRQAENTALPPA